MRNIAAVCALVTGIASSAMAGDFPNYSTGDVGEIGPFASSSISPNVGGDFVNLGRPIPKPLGATIMTGLWLPLSSFASSAQVTSANSRIDQSFQLIQQLQTAVTQTQTTAAQNQLAIVQTQSALAQTQFAVTQTQLAIAQTQSVLTQTQFAVAQTQLAVSQLQSAAIRADRGIAAVAAMANVSMPSAPGKTTWALNGAMFQNELGGGLSVAHRLDVSVPVAVTGAYGNGGGNAHVGRVGLMGEF